MSVAEASSSAGGGGLQEVVSDEELVRAMIHNEFAIRSKAHAAIIKSVP